MGLQNELAENGREASQVLLLAVEKGSKVATPHRMHACFILSSRGTQSFTMP